ncbi:hypothetical protein NDU88_005481 [Pleurodeles waltl]|uniref:Myb-like domain-containing protein n=1 Tax=Pleurodeles waltl TaxID=8319 RepID=A0AAV7NP55_PLEWA|nr:hypothetical protein NDU88_005481 [Pleurodeles waltl]
MVCVTGQQALAFTAEELEKVVDGVLPLYAKLYRRPEAQVSAHQKKGMWQAIAKEVRTLGVYNWRSTHCRKRWEDLWPSWGRLPNEGEERVGPEPPNGPHTGGGLSRFGWALEGSRASTRR